MSYLPVTKKTQRYHDAIRACTTELNVDPTRIYCSITGRPIGRLDPSVFADVMEEIPVAADKDEIIEDLMIRTLSSMRPSPAWNYVDRSSLREYVKTRPIETLCYLLNRLYEPADRLKIDFSRRMTYHHERIKLYQLVSHVSQYDLGEWMYLLIEIDALYNLTTLSIPGNSIQVTLAALAGERDDEAFESFMNEWRAWHLRLYETYEKKQKAAIQQTEWLKGNPAAGTARFSMFMESKPKSEAQKKKETKHKADNEMMALLRGIMSAAESGETIESTPTPKSVGFIPAGGLRGLKIAGRN